MPVDEHRDDLIPARSNFRVGERIHVARHAGGWLVEDVRQGGFGVVYVVRAGRSADRDKAYLDTAGRRAACASPAGLAERGAWGVMPGQCCQGPSPVEARARRIAP